MSFKKSSYIKQKHISHRQRWRHIERDDVACFCTPCTPCFLAFFFKKNKHLLHCHVGPFLFSVLRVLRVFGIFIFSRKKYICTAISPTSLPHGAVWLVERRSSENHGVHGVQKIDDVIPANVAPLPRGRVVGGEEKQRKSRSTRST